MPELLQDKPVIIPGIPDFLEDLFPLLHVHEGLRGEDPILGPYTWRNEAVRVFEAHIEALQHDGFLEFGLQNADIGGEAGKNIFLFLWSRIQDHKQNPKDDLITYLLNAEVDGQPVPEQHVLGTSFLILLAGIDTTWSSIGSALWHLAQNPQDRKRLTNEPELIGTAVEELLRAYSPVTMARVVPEDFEYGGCPMSAGDRVIVNFPAANRDPEKFADPDKVIIDRHVNPHIAFGVGIHRCAGSNLARMEMRVSIEEWLKRIPEFGLEDPEAVTWAGGQVRGPRSMPVVWA